MKCTLSRTFRDSKQVNGIWTIENLSFTAKTLELPWLNNQPQISCIPPGVYQCGWTFSSHFERNMYEVLSVPNRAGIRIHSANYYLQLLGCIAIGSALKDLNADGEMDTLHSGDTVRAFEVLAAGKPFQLTITQNF